MRPHVFVGPTLRPEDLAAFDFVWLPPVAQGDVYRLTLERPTSIGIIDGYFSGVPAVWHKEILWAMTQGIPVFGSASMGALRAAELHGFGMRGVGRIFEGFRDGELEDDDEVAIVHGPAETGFVAASEAMVNIRATLARAAAEGVIGSEVMQMLERIAKSLFFPDRSWPRLLKTAAAQGVGPAELTSFTDWLPQGRVDRKRADALEMLQEMARSDPPAEDVGPRFRFEWTSHWDGFVARASDTIAHQQSSILTELRLEGREAYLRVRDRALLRCLADRESRRLGLRPSLGTKREALTRLRSARGLMTRDELESWLIAHHLDAQALDGLLEEEVSAQAALANPIPARLLLDELRWSGDYERLAARARDKERIVKPVGQAGRAPQLPDLMALRLWLFEQRQNSLLPEDIEGFAREMGFAGVEELDDALRDEWLFTSQKED
jgi:hypothetical protein